MTCLCIRCRNTQPGSGHIQFAFLAISNCNSYTCEFIINTLYHTSFIAMSTPTDFSCFWRCCQIYRLSFILISIFLIFTHYLSDECQESFFADNLKIFSTVADIQDFMLSQKIFTLQEK